MVLAVSAANLDVRRTNSKGIECGWMKKDLTLKDREWVCEGCGCVVDRDLNAARNIRDFALRDYFAPEDKGSEPESYTLRKEVAQEKECAIRAEAPSL